MVCAFGDVDVRLAYGRRWFRDMMEPPLCGTVAPNGAPKQTSHVPLRD